ncbi:MAG: 2-oxoacid:acceptor oxidoreductase family protein [Chloroflexia bacterium]
MDRVEVRFCGFGGQGIILAGFISGKAATLYDRRNAALTQSYGPESRGGACSAELIISDEPILYPHLLRPNVLVAMSQPAYERYREELAPDGLLIVDADLVEPGEVPPGVRLYAIPATRLAEELGRSVVANIVMLGFFTAVAGVISEEAMRQAILSSVPPGTEELNQRAFERGWNYGKEVLARPAASPAG